MKRMILAGCGLALLLGLLAPIAASAQYVTPPGQGPTVGGTDTGQPSNDIVTPPPGDDPAEVLGRQFTRDIGSTDANGFALQWLWLMLALALGLLFLFFWRRRRDEEEEDDFAGAQPA